MRKEGCGDIVKINTTHIGRCGKTGKIAYNTAANGNHTILSGKAMVEHILQELPENLKTLGFFSCFYGVDKAFLALGGKGICVALRHAGIRYDQHPPVQIQILAGFCQNAPFCDDIVAVLA